MQPVIGVVLWIVSVALAVAVTARVVRKRDEEQLARYQDRVLGTHRDEVQNIYTKMRRWRHDYHNHMQKIKAHLALGQLEEVTEYLNRLEEDLDAIDITVKTGNISVDAILSSKLSVAAEKGITINCSAKVPEQLAVSDVDLCAIIGNLIDNSVESCGKLRDGGERMLRVYIGVLKQQLYISVMNSTKEKERKRDSEFVSSKRGNHGHGLKRIDDIVKKYDGFINRKNEPGAFVTEIMLPL